MSFLLQITVIIMIANMPSTRLTEAVDMALVSVLDWSVFCGLKICGLFTPYTNNV